MNKNVFIEEIKKLGIVLTDKQLSQLEEYYNLLINWNEKINLTRITDKDEVYLKHFYDSLTIAKYVNKDNILKLCDIGTGAGFPGLVLKIVFPTLSITLVDSLQKRINFLNEVIEKLGLVNIETIHMRAEDFIKIRKNSYDIVTSRAVARLNVLIDYCVPLLHKKGQFIAMKANCDEEIKESLLKIKNKGCQIKEIYHFKLPIEDSNRTIVCIEKQ